MVDGFAGRIPPEKVAAAPSWIVAHYDRPFTANQARRWHWSKVHAKTAEWRQAFGVLARAAKVPRLDRVRITAVVHLAGRPLDTDAIAPTVKAAIDGLVDAKVIPDDTPAHVLGVAYAPPVMGQDRDALILQIEDAGG